MHNDILKFKKEAGKITKTKNFFKEQKKINLNLIFKQKCITDIKTKDQDNIKTSNVLK